MFAAEIFGFVVPDDRPLFIAALAAHVPAGMVAVGSGAVAALSPKRPSRHPIAGRVYLASLLVVGLSAGLLAGLRWRHDWYLALLDLGACTVAVLGLVARRRQRAGWMIRHGIAMAGSYVLLLTAFYVDNGPQLPLWNRLPTLALWLLPVAVGAPLTAWALVRNRARAVSSHEVAGM